MATRPSQPFSHAARNATSPSSARCSEKRIGSAEGDRAMQHRLPCEQRQLGEVVSVEPDQVEQVEDHGHGRDLCRTGFRVLHPFLQVREGGHLSLERDDLTVGDHRSGVVPKDGLDQIGIVRGAILLVPRDQPDARASPPQQRALTVELGLEDPRRVGERLFGQRGEHHRREGRHRATPEQSPIGCVEFAEDGVHRVEADVLASYVPARTGIAVDSFERKTRR